MAVRPPVYRPPSAPDRQASTAEYEARRGTPAERGYDWRWRKESKRFLVANPWCAMCLAATPRRYTAARVVDHKIPHRGDQRLFWDANNWESLCESHHNSDKQRIEREAARRG